jgi:hypothetical protein
VNHAGAAAPAGAPITDALEARLTSMPEPRG